MGFRTPTGQSSRQPPPKGRLNLVSIGLPLAALLLLLGLVPAAFAAAENPAPSKPPTEASLLEDLSRTGTNVSGLYRLADFCHDAGVNGDKKAVERAEGYLRQLLAIESTNAPAIALLGSVFTLKGRDAFWPTTQLSLVHEGNEMMDKAVAMAPEDLRTRITRGFNNAHMPDFLGRTEIVKADLAWLWERFEKMPDRFSTVDRQELSLQWGRQLKRQRRPEDARRVWEEARALDPSSKSAKEIETELSKLR